MQKKKNKVILITFFCFIFLIIVAVLVIAFIRLSSSDKLGDQDGIWSCYGLGGFNQVYFNKGDELTKKNEIKISGNRFEIKDAATGSEETGEIEIFSERKSIDSSLKNEIDIRVDNKKVVYYGTNDQEAVYERNYIALYPNKDTKTNDGGRYRIDIIAWNAQNKAKEAIASTAGSNAENYFSAASMDYCINDPGLATYFTNQER